MSKRIDLFDNTYSHFTEQVLNVVRKETFVNDIGQNSWMTADEYDRFIGLLQLGPKDHVLEVASGSGGPALYLANKCGCRVTGIDANENGITTANEFAAKSNAQVNFKLADANSRLPFDEDSFDGLLCIDSHEPFSGSVEGVPRVAADLEARTSCGVYGSGCDYRGCYQR